MYPQPDSNQAAVLNQGQFRLKTSIGNNTLAVSGAGGDIYESEQSGVAYAIGPDSDMSRVVVAYFDPTNPPNFMSSVEVTPQRPYLGLLPARLDTTYQPSNRKARVLMFINDYYDGNYVPNNFNGAQDKITIAVPILDFIQYFKVPAQLPVRNDRTYAYNEFIIPNPGTRWYVVPCYGRSYASIRFTNFDAVAGGITFGVLGLNFSPTEPANHQQQETTLVAAAAVAQNATVNRIVRRAVDGPFDMLVFSLVCTKVSPIATLNVYLSDNPQ